jgi:hypothetical protein
MSWVTVLFSPIKYFWDFYAISSTGEAAKKGISKFSAGFRMFLWVSLIPATMEIKGVRAL